LVLSWRGSGPSEFKKTLHNSYINKNWKETAQYGPVKLENMFLIVFPSHQGILLRRVFLQSLLIGHMHPYKGLFLKFLTESFERIPFLDFGGRNARTRMNPVKGGPLSLHK